MRYEKYLVTESNETKNAKGKLKKQWGSAPLDVVFSWESNKGAWIVIGKHPNTNKYYGVNYLDEIIDAAPKTKALNWARKFTTKPVKFDE